MIHLVRSLDPRGDRLTAKRAVRKMALIVRHVRTHELVSVEATTEIAASRNARSTCAPPCDETGDRLAPGCDRAWQVLCRVSGKHQKRCKLDARRLVVAQLVLVSLAARSLIPPVIFSIEEGKAISFVRGKYFSYLLRDYELAENIVLIQTFASSILLQPPLLTLTRRVLLRFSP
jgi:hypothetical protein